MNRITDRQMLLEYKYGKPIRDVLTETLEKHRGRRHHTVHTASELDVTVSTLYKWSERLGIDLNSYASEETLAAGAATRENR